MKLIKNNDNVYKENCKGSYFVIDDCIACDTCTEIASNHFKLTTDYDHAYVHVQPKSKKEINLCQDALQACPVGAIKKND